MRWSGGRTFAAALDRQAVRAQLIEADRNGYLEETEDELFRFARTVEANPELRNALGDRAVVLQELREEAARGAVVVVATHDPAVVEACDLHIALDEGRVVR